MSPRWIRGRPAAADTAGAALVAGAVALAAGAVTFYVARLLLSREPLEGRQTKTSAAPAEEGGA